MAEKFPPKREVSECLFRLDFILFNKRVESGPADADFAGGTGDVSAVPRERLLDVDFLHQLFRLAQGA